MTFDLIPEEYVEPVAEKVLQLPSDYAFSEEFINFGEESAYILMLMFLPFATIILTTLYYLSLLLFYKLAKALNICKNRRRKAKQSFFDIYSFYTRFLMEMSLEFSVLGLVELVVRQV